MQDRATNRPPHRDRSALNRGDAGTRVRVGLVALAIAGAFSVATYSSVKDDQVLLRASLAKGADRLLAQQLPDGSWPATPGGRSGDLSRSGRIARALVQAHAVLEDERYLAAAARCAEALAGEVERSPRIASVGNLSFLARFGQVAGEPRLTELAARVRARQLEKRGTRHPVAAARELVGRANTTDWTEGAWRNYLLWHAGEHAELARSVGENDWADAFTVAVAESWAPKQDRDWWAMGSGRMLEALSKVPGERARRLASVHLELIRANELLPGLPWNETPYDTSVFAQESASVLQGLLASRDVEGRRRAMVGLRVLALAQAPHGGWGAEIGLVDRPAAPGLPCAPPAELAVRESLEVDAAIVGAMAQGLRTAPTLPSATRDRRVASVAPAGATRG